MAIGYWIDLWSQKVLYSKVMETKVYYGEYTLEYWISLILKKDIILPSYQRHFVWEKNDVETLRCLGASDKQIARIFMLEGRMISLIGAVAGVLFGLLLCWLQQEYGLVRLGSSSGSFVVDAYPVSVHYVDVAIVFFTVIAVGWIAVWYPVRYMSNRLLQK